MQECFDLNGRKEKIPLSPPPPLSGGFPLLLQKVAKIIIPFIFPLSEPNQPSSINLILLPTTLGGGHFQKRTSSPSGQHRMHTRLPDQPSRSLIRPNGDGRRTTVGGGDKRKRDRADRNIGRVVSRTYVRAVHTTLGKLDSSCAFLSSLSLSLSMRLRGRTANYAFLCCLHTKKE